MGEREWQGQAPRYGVSYKNKRPRVRHRVSDAVIALCGDRCALW